MFFIYLAVALVMRSVMPIQKNDGGPNFDKMYNYTTSEFYKETDYGLLNFSRACQGNDSFVIGGVDSYDHQYSKDIFDKLYLKMDDHSKQLFNFRHFGSIQELEEFSASPKNIGVNKLCFAIMVNKYDVNESNFNISIRYSPELLPPTKNMTFYQQGDYDFTAYDMMNNISFPQVLVSVTEKIMSDIEDEDNRIQFSLNLAPTYSRDQWLNDPQINLSPSFIGMVIAQMPFLPMVLTAIFQDKNEENIFSLAKSMGFTPKAFLVTYIIMMTIMFFLLYIPTAIVAQVVLFPRSNPLILFIYSIISTYNSLFMGSFLYFALGKWGSIIFSIYGCIQAILPAFFINTVIPGPYSYILTPFLPSISQVTFMKVLAAFEVRMGGIGFNNINQTAFENSPLILLITMIATMFFFLILNIWLWPITVQQEGKKLSLCYCFMPSYYRKNRKKNRDDTLISVADTNNLLNKGQNNQFELDQSKVLLKEEEILMNNGDFEKPNLEEFIADEPNYLDDTLRIVNLIKEFKSYDKNQKVNKAVDGLNLSAYKNQILTLLGHNGAGKTTTISMITGFLQATSGQVHAFQLDAFKQRDLMNQIVGICPQEDSLISNMTVYQNIQFFCKLRGMSDDEINEYTNEMLISVSLQQKKDTVVKNLSGGQKRKLQLLIALAGDTSIILLDEPSSGMDPQARRETWDLIKSCKKDRIIILTTHYMDEADELGDRIAIMSQGKLRCCGSSFFLKKKFGMGTLLEINQIDSTKPMNDLNQMIATFCEKDKDQINSPTVEGQFDESTRKYIIKMPIECYSNFNQIFEILDDPNNSQRFNIQEYNVRISTLEEVFNEIGQQDAKTEFQDVDKQNTFGIKTNQQAVSESQNFKMKYKFKEISYMQKIKVLLKLRKYQGMPFYFVSVIMTVLYMIITFMQVNVGATGGFQTFNDNNAGSIFNSTSSADSIINFGFAQQFDTDHTAIQIQQFMQTNAFNVKNWDDGFKQQPLSVTYDQNLNNITQSIEQFSHQMLANSELENDPIYYHGGIFINNGLDENDQVQKNNLTVHVLTNQSATVNCELMNGLSVGAILQLRNPNLKINIYQQPLPPNTIIQQAVVLPVTMMTLFMMGYCLVMYTTLLIGLLMREKSNNFQLMLHQNGIRHEHQFWSQLILMIIANTITAVIMNLFVLLPIFNMQGLWLLTIIWVLSQSSFDALMIMVLSPRAAKGYTALQNLVLLVMLGLSFAVFATKAFEPFGLIEYFYSWIPLLGLIQGFFRIQYRAQWKAQDMNTDPWGINGCQPELIMLSLGVVVWPLLSFLYMKKQRAKTKLFKYSQVQQTTEANDDEANGQNIDSDVLAENNRVKQLINNQQEPEAITVMDLKKDYIIPAPSKRSKSKKQQDDEEAENIFDLLEPVHQDKDENQGIKKAVRGISFSLKKDECFILLGVNGAGKTTTFKCLTSEEVLSDGKIMINGKPLSELIENQSNNLIGYCPQINPLIHEYTVLQSLVFFAQLNGIENSSDCQQFAEEYATEFQLGKFLNTKTVNLSGGNKRKLCTAVALLGSPQIVFLDESSAGVDPFARKMLWTSLRKFSKNSALIVTTHSMEEAEALGTKMAIMVNGKFKCFGSAQSLKQKFGEGFTVHIKFDDNKVLLKNQAFIEGINEHIDKYVKDRQNDPNCKDQNLVMTEPELVSQIQEWQKLCRIIQSSNQQPLSIENKNPVDFRKELTSEGLLKGFKRRIVKQIPIDLKELFRTMLFINEVMLLIYKIEQRMGLTHVTDLSGNEFSLKISQTNDKSIGYLFGFIQELMDQFPIKEYQAQQMSLEEIFNSFAKKQFLSSFNSSLKRNSVRLLSIREKSTTSEIQNSRLDDNIETVEEMGESEYVEKEDPEIFKN